MTNITGRAQRRYLIFTTLAGVIAGFPQRVSLIMGAGFATLLTMVQLLS